jgi:predicted nucleotide-binding protein
LISHTSFVAKIREQLSEGEKIYKGLQDERQIPQFEKEYGIWDDYNNEYLKSVFNIVDNEYRHSYSNAGSMVGVHEVLLGASIHNPIYKLMTSKQRLEEKLQELESLIKKADLIPSNSNPASRTVKNSETDSNKHPVVFIIHGHDEEMKRNVQLFLNRGDLQDIVLHEQPDRNRTVIEKLIEKGSSADYVIALLSPDDVQEDGSMRARQNVILEIGFFIGKLGRDKVRLLRREGTVIPSDLQGILYDNYDKDGAWRIKILKRNSSIRDSHKY